jgi:hypothetical protein
MPSFSSFGQAVSEEKICLNQSIRNKELPVATKFVNGSEHIVQSLERTFYICFLPSFSSFGRGVSEENIKMSKVNERDDRRQVMGKAHFAFGKES